MFAVCGLVVCRSQPQFVTFNSVIAMKEEPRMSYPSIHAQLAEQGTTLEAANENQLHAAFIGAFEKDLPLGFAKVGELVDTLRGSGKDRVMQSLNPNSPEGQQYARLLGPDIPRQVLERHHGVAFGFYNCCGGVAAVDKDKLGMSLREQIEAQDPNFVDC